LPIVAAGDVLNGQPAELSDVRDVGAADSDHASRALIGSVLRNLWEGPDMKLLRDGVMGVAVAAVLTLELLLGLVALVFTMYIVVALTEASPRGALVWGGGILFVIMLAFVFGSAGCGAKAGPGGRPDAKATGF
jgi:hypothetical protein